MTTRWVGRESTEAITDVRMRCYGSSPSQRSDFLARTQRDRFDDVLMCEQDGRAIGTATNVPLSIRVRGGKLPCQGVAWVGTVKSHRRRRVDGQGIASTIMRQMLAHARERGDVISALMPFRASFYEHFGYGVVERQNIWTVPLSLLPAAESDGFVEASETDVEAMAACRSRQGERGQCDVDGGAEGIHYWMRELAGSAFHFVDRPNPQGPVRGFLHVTDLLENGQQVAMIDEPAYDSPESLLRLLSFLGSLRDQYSAARLILPTDLPFNWLLKERQVPHRRVDHPVASCNCITRMQLRILDHGRFLAALNLPSGVRGKLVVSVRESEGTESRFALEIDNGRASGQPTGADPELTVSDHLWASLVTGALSPSTARDLGLLTLEDQAIAFLGAFGVGAKPFSWEYF